MGLLRTLPLPMLVSKNCGMKELRSDALFPQAEMMYYLAAFYNSSS